MKILSAEIISHFAKMVCAYQRSLFRLWIVAPWIGSFDKKHDPLKRIIHILSSTRADLTIITRPPKHTWHINAVTRLIGLKNANVFTCQDLHTKLYLMECDGFRMAILGSPNLTPKANWENKELAIEIRTTKQSYHDSEFVLIKNLINYASSLRKDPNVNLKTHS